MAFEGLKEAISIEPVLWLPDLDLPFEVQTDVSVELWVESWCRKGTLWRLRAGSLTMLSKGTPLTRRR